MTNYYTTPALSQSGIKKYLTDGAHRYWQTSPYNPNSVAQIETEALLKGKLVDCILFTPSEFDKIYAVKLKMDGRTKDGKAYNSQFEIDNVGKVIINEQEQQDAEKMVFHLLHNEDFITLNANELSTQEEFFWEEDGMAFKAKMDRIVSWKGEPVILDYKTCQNCDEAHFSKDIIKFGYHIQAAFYKRAFFMKYGVEARFVLVPQEKDFPENMAIWEVQACDIAIGKRAIAKATHEIKARLAKADWKPYKGGIQEVNLPTWFYTQQQENELTD